MGAMDNEAVAVRSVPPAAASRQTRHARHSQFQETTSMGALEWGRAEAHVIRIVVVDVAIDEVHLTP